MKTKIMKLLKRPFVRNVMIMATGTAAAQAVSLVLSPIITRLYGPEAYGLMGVFMAIVAIVGPIAALTYPIAIVLPKEDKDAKGIAKLSLVISTCFAILACLLLLIFKDPIVKLFNMEPVAPFVLLIPVVILFAGIFQVTEQWLIRTKQFRVSARVAFVQALLLQGGKAGIGFFHPVASVLIVLTAIGEGVRAGLMMLFARKSLNFSTADLKDKSVDMKTLAKSHRDFPMYRAPQVLLNAVSQNIPVLMLTTFFGPAAAGFYAIGRTVLSMPTQLIGKSVGDVFYPRISEASNNQENLTRLIRKATFSLGAIGFVPFALVVAFGPWLFSFVFGAEWHVAGEYARWMALWVYFMFVNQPSVKAFPVLAKQGFHLSFTIITLILRTSALFIGYYMFNSDLVAVALFGIVGAILNILLIVFALRFSSKFDKERGVE
ncbi:lipopolysaccharide biosynthesis protein [Ornithinibacillus sp. 179-J 7C1 HS]|uniref:lipopolysaccharide biosynthesis protein n=1 Tax=Ornithinibacillus sp. 179-J 7C1 HS TaxID=3142384 RepID=UPI00399FBC7F